MYFKFAANVKFIFLLSSKILGLQLCKSSDSQCIHRRLQSHILNEIHAQPADGIFHVELPSDLESHIRSRRRSRSADSADECEHDLACSQNLAYVDEEPSNTDLLILKAERYDTAKVIESEERLRFNLAAIAEYDFKSAVALLNVGSLQRRFTGAKFIVHFHKFVPLQHHDTTEPNDDINRIVDKYHEEWLYFDLTNVALYWLKNPELNLGFTINIAIINEKGEHLYKENVSEKHIFLELEKPRLGHRTQRSAQRCCDKSLRLDFAEVGWNWVMSPAHLDVSICREPCRRRRRSLSIEPFFLIYRTDSGALGERLISLRRV